MGEMDFSLEKECGALGALFQTVVNEMKTAYPCWEDLGQKAVKLSHQLKATIAAVNQFLDALQKVADVATNAKGSTRDIGTALTRICMRHRSIENRVKTLSSSLLDCLVQPIQDRADDWKQKVVNLDKEHAKEFKKNRADIKKRAGDTARLQKRVKKGEARMQPMLDSAVQEVNDRYLVLIESERKMVRKALTEQRAQFCYFVSWFKPVLDQELGLLEEVSQMQDVTDLLCKHAAEPYSLPQSSEAVIYDVKGLEHTWNQAIHSPPSSPSSLGSRKSSFCSLSSADSSNQPMNLPPPHRIYHHNMQHRGMKQLGMNNGVSQQQTWMNQQAPTSPRFSSLSSQDSGFVASQQDAIYASRKQLQNSDEDDGSTPGSVEGGVGSNSTPSPSENDYYAQLNSLRYNHSQQNSPQHQENHRPHTISGAFEGRINKGRPSLMDAGLLPPQPRHMQAQQHANDTSRPPTRPGYLGVQRCASNSGVRSNRTTPMQTPTPTCTPAMPPTIPDFHANQPDQVTVQPLYANFKELNHRSAMMTEGGTLVKGQRNRRPNSFVGDEHSLHKFLEEEARLQSMKYGDEAPLSSRSSEATIVADEEVFKSEHDHRQSSLPLPTMQNNKVPSGYCTISRGVKFRERSGSTGSNSRHTTLPVVPESVEQVYASSAASVSSFGGVSRRNSMCTKPPPPPVRRNSTITAATPTAPAVDFVRSNSRCTTPVEEPHILPLHQQWTQANLQQQQQQQQQQYQQYINSPHNQSPNRLMRPPSLEGIPQYVTETNVIYQSVAHRGAPQAMNQLQRECRAGSEPSANQYNSREFSVQHETLLMQIRSGIPLKTGNNSNDRSKPKI